MPYIAIKGFPKDDETVRKVAERINATLLELWGCRQEHINISICAGGQKLRKAHPSEDQGRGEKASGRGSVTHTCAPPFRIPPPNKPSRTECLSLPPERTPCTLSM